MGIKLPTLKRSKSPKVVEDLVESCWERNKTDGGIRLVGAYGPPSIKAFLESAEGSKWKETTNVVLYMQRLELLIPPGVKSIRVRTPDGEHWMRYNHPWILAGVDLTFRRGRNSTPANPDIEAQIQLRRVAWATDSFLEDRHLENTNLTWAWLPNHELTLSRILPFINTQTRFSADHDSMFWESISSCQGSSMLVIRDLPEDDFIDHFMPKADNIISTLLSGSIYNSDISIGEALAYCLWGNESVFSFYETGDEHVPYHPVNLGEPCAVVQKKIDYPSNPDISDFSYSGDAYGEPTAPDLVEFNSAEVCMNVHQSVFTEHDPQECINDGLLRTYPYSPEAYKAILVPKDNSFMLHRTQRYLVSHRNYATRNMGEIYSVNAPDKVHTLKDECYDGTFDVNAECGELVPNWEYLNIQTDMTNLTLCPDCSHKI